MVSPVVGTVLMVGLAAVMPVSVVVWAGSFGDCGAAQANVGPKSVQVRGCAPEVCVHPVAQRTLTKCGATGSPPAAGSDAGEVWASGGGNVSGADAGGGCEGLPAVDLALCARAPLPGAGV